MEKQRARLTELLESKASAFEGIDVESEMDKEIDSLADIDKTISEERTHLMSIANRITELETQSAELELALSRNS